MQQRKSFNKFEIKIKMRIWIALSKFVLANKINTFSFKERNKYIKLKYRNHIPSTL